MEIKYSPTDKDGPTPKAKIIVPIPMVPPSDHPKPITVISKILRSVYKNVTMPLGSHSFSHFHAYYVFHAIV